MENTTETGWEGWRKSEKADELRAFIDSSFKVRKPTMGGLERELIIDFAAKEIQRLAKEEYERGRKDTVESIATLTKIFAEYPEMVPKDTKVVRLPGLEDILKEAAIETQP